MSAIETRQAGPLGPGGRTPRQWRQVGGSVATIAVVLGAVVIAGAVWGGGEFLSAENLTTITAAAAIPLIIGVAAAIGLLAGVVDLSIGSVAALGAMVFATLIADGAPPLLAALAAVAAGVVVGVINGTCVVTFGAESLIATLGALTAVRGLVLVLADGHSQTAFVEGLYDFTARTWGSLNVLFVLALIWVAVAAAIVLKTRPGRHVRAVGGDDRAAARAGIPVGRIRFCALVTSATVAALGGVLYVGQLGTAPVTLGTGLEFDVYAALMIGGYSITRGGIGNPIGACLGILAIAALGDLLDLRSVSGNWQDVIVGTTLVAAVYADRLRGGEEFR